MTTPAKPGDTVKVHYTGRLESGEVFDSSRDREPLAFTLGAGQMIPGFEQAVLGMTPGQAKTETLPPEQAYGSRREDLLLRVPREQLPQDLRPEVGQTLEVRRADGPAFPVRVAEVSEETVTLDANHPLAGQPLVFDIELVEIA